MQKQPKNHLGVRLSLAIMVVVGIMLSCSKEPPILPLEVEGFDKKVVIVEPLTKIKFKLNQRVTWKISAGSVFQNDQDTLIYTTQALAGVTKMTIKSERNPMDSLVITVATTPKASILKPMQKGGYVFVFRHAAADVGVDQTASLEANWWRSCDSKIARQLNDVGKSDANAIGKAIKALQIPVARVLSSEFCRCFTTADLMKLDSPTQSNKDLTYWVYDENNRYGNTMKVAVAQPIDDKNSLLVIHAGFSGNIPSSAPLTSLNWGDAAVFQLQTSQEPKYLGNVLIQHFLDLAK